MHVYPNALEHAIEPDGRQGAYDQPGLKDMTLKAIDILSARAKKRGTGWTLMSEAALIDKVSLGPVLSVPYLCHD
jgi:alkaline phosphatase